MTNELMKPIMGLNPLFSRMLKLAAKWLDGMSDTPFCISTVDLVEFTNMIQKGIIDSSARKTQTMQIAAFIGESL
jgi:hypothetical protein